VELSTRLDFSVGGAQAAIDLRHPKGRIDRYEIQDFVRTHIGTHLTEADLDSIIRRGDIDGDEQIGYNELDDLIHQAGIPESTNLSYTSSYYVTLREREIAASEAARRTADRIALERELEAKRVADRLASERAAIEADAAARRTEARIIAE